MPTLYIAYRSDTDAGVRLASGSMKALKQRMRAAGPASYLLATYRIKPDVATLCLLVEDIGEVEAEQAHHYEVTEAGQVRRLDAP